MAETEKQTDKDNKSAREAQAAKIEARVRVKAQAKGLDVTNAVYVLHAFIPKEEQGKVFSRPFVAIFRDKVVQFRKSLFSPSNEEIPIERISSVAISSGLIPVVTVYTSGNIMTFDTDVLQGPKFVEILKSLLPKESKVSAPSSGSGIDQLEKLSILFEKGHLTKSEFDTKKKQILGL